MIVAACRLLSAGNAVVTTWLNSFAQKTWHAQHQNKGLTQIFAAYLRCMRANASMSFASLLQKWGIKYLQVSQSSHACVHAHQKEPKNGPTLVPTNANALMAAIKENDVRKYLPDSRTDPSDWKTGKSVEEIGKLKSEGKFVVNGCRFPRKSGGGEKAGTKYALWVGSRAGDSPAKRTFDAAHREQQSILVTKPLCDHGKQNWVDTNFRRHFSADLGRRQHLSTSFSGAATAVTRWAWRTTDTCSNGSCSTAMGMPGGKPRCCIATIC